MIFSQMDSDIISVYKDLNEGKKEPNFVLHKEFKNAGEMPFDAMLQEQKLYNGLFNSAFFGVVDLEKMEYKK